MMRRPAFLQPANAKPGRNAKSPAQLIVLFLLVALLVGRCRLRAQNPAPAVQDFNTPDVNKLLQAAQDALDEKKFDSAATTWEKVVKLRPDFAPAWFNLGYAYTALGRKDDAVAAYQKTLDLKPDLFQAQLNLGILLIEMNRASEAAEYLEKAASLKPDSHRAHIYFARALAAEPSYPDWVLVDDRLAGS